MNVLREPAVNYWHAREGNDFSSPQQGIFGPKVMIINEMAGSGGDWLPFAFRKLNIGPLVGTRTWGGLVGNYTTPNDALDGGYVATPDVAFYDLDGLWEVENHGVEPDVRVEDDPKAEREGSDPQLERAIAVAMDLLGKGPTLRAPRHAPYPDYYNGARP